MDKQYVCNNVIQVAKKIAELTNTAIDKETIKQYCYTLKKEKKTSDTFDYTAFDENEKEHDVTVWLGYDYSTKEWFVSVIE